DIFNGAVSRNEIVKALKIAVGVTGGFILLVILIPGIAGSFIGQYEADLPGWLKSALIDDRKALLKSDAFRSLTFIILSAGVILAFLYDKLKKGPAILILTLLIVFDLWTIDKRYLDADRFEMPSTYQKTFKPSVADADIMKDKSIYRVLNLTVSTFNDNSPTSYFHKSIGGYHGAKLKRYQELIDTSLINNIKLIQTVGSNAKSLEEFQSVFYSTYILNMLNVKYVIYNPDAPPLVNRNALGNAWFVEKPVMVANANKEISAINFFDPSEEAIVDNAFKDQITKPLFPVMENEKIELISYQPDELHYKYSAQEEKLIVFSEIYYPAGWKSYIDGKESKYFRTNYVLRGMVVPSGDHEIKFVFQPSSYIIGNKISLASSVILILLLGSYFITKFRMKSKSE
ncbi:MAG TPA: YfhO family protein, partial [Anaerovoracaceae bacterium]|nr:YfhO family protein [Anaerovoracaceae bacterium]